MSETISIRGRVVAITGGARGIGLATAHRLRAAGARVAIGDVDADAAVAAAESLGADVLASPLEVTSRSSFEDFIALVERELGPLDVLINNAGIMPIGPMLDEPEDIAARVLAINVGGCLTGMKVALPRMLERRSGHVVNVASVAGKSPVPGGASYAATKAAVISLTETARVEFAGTGVSFTCVMPSFTATELIAGTKGTKFVKTIEPDDVAAAVTAAVAKPRPDVYVPRAVGAIVRLHGLTGRKLRDAGNKALGADRAFLDVDRSARAAYDARIAGTAAATAERASDDTPVARRP